MIALEQLGLAPCYHMRDLLANLEAGLPLWEAVAEGRPDWERIFNGAPSTCDWPSARYWRELADYYPDAKIILSVRETSVWVPSMRETVWGMYHGDSLLHHLCEARAKLDPSWERFMTLMRHISWNDQTGALNGDTFSDAGLGAAMERWNEDVRQTAPPDRLLVWDPRDGFAPLCDFLEVAMPAEPLPRVNDTAGFREGIMGGAIRTLNEWWQQHERPPSGLHGARLP
jgi:hypothetical protein